MWTKEQMRKRSDVTVADTGHQLQRFYFLTGKCEIISGVYKRKAVADLIQAHLVVNGRGKYEIVRKSI